MWVGDSGNETYVSEPTVKEDLLVPDLSKDEYVSYASSDVFHARVVKKVSQNETDLAGELEQQWQVKVTKAFKGDAEGTAIVNTMAYVDGEGNETAGEGGVALVPGRGYVFAGQYDADNERYEPFGGITGARLSQELDSPAKSAARSTASESGETVEEHWEQAVTNERPGPPVDGATPDSDMVEAPEGEQ
ncbi:hypothetical protein FGD71_000360 [Streptomyces sporangiiformans]|uniref:Uncharacterized protein n=1 Tax=Streptomyces sporangiiformans TaxID=2315329 RepID=A0A505DT28_9ACTN|nr:hypothetical protein FGD71_000360 [Streptomyces sporangiiformans]